MYTGELNVLFFFPQNDSEASPTFRGDIVKKLPAIIVLDLLAQLMIFNQNIQNYIDQGIFTAEDIERMKLPIRLRSGTMSQLYKELIIIRDCCATDGVIKNNDLFQKVNPILYELYQRYYAKAQGLTELEKILHAFSLVRSLSVEELLDISKTQDPSALELYRKANAIKTSSFDFENRTQSLEDALIELIQAINFAVIPPIEQKAILDHLLQFQGFVELTITRCDAMDDAWLNNLALHAASLTSLKLIDCNNVTEDGLAFIVNYLPNVELVVSQTDKFAKNKWPAAIAKAAKRFTLILSDGYEIYLDKRSPFTTKDALVLAAKNNSTEAVKYLLQIGFDVNQEDEQGFTALHYAAQHGNQKMVELLLEHKPKLDLQTIVGSYTPFYLAAKHGYTKIVEIFLSLRLRAKMECKTVLDETVLHAVAQKGSVELFKKCIAAVKTNMLKEKDKLGKTLLHFACTNRDTNVLEFCLSVPELKAFINLPDSVRNTPLHVAVMEGKIEHVKLLLAANANPSLANLSGLTPLKIATLLQREQIISLLPPAEISVAPAATLVIMKTELHSAIEAEDFGTVLKLLSPRKVTVDVTAVTPDQGLTAFHLAANGVDRLHYTWSENSRERWELEYKYINCMERLLAASANINPESTEGDTPLQIALRYSRSEKIIQWLINHGANIFCKNKDGSRLMHDAVVSQKNCSSMVKLLFHNGLIHQVNECDINKQYPLHLLISKNFHSLDEQLEAFELLVEAMFTLMKAEKWAVNYFDTQKNEMEEKPLHCAAKLCNYKITKVLIDHTANIDEPSLDGSTPLHLALYCYAGINLALNLKQENLSQNDNNATNSEEFNTLKSRLYDAERVIKTLLKRKPNVYRKDLRGKTSLDLAKPFPQIYEWVSNVAKLQKATNDDELQGCLVNIVLDDLDFEQLYEYISERIQSHPELNLIEYKIFSERYKHVYNYILGNGVFDTVNTQGLEKKVLGDIRVLAKHITFLEGQLILQPASSQIIHASIELCKRLIVRARNRLSLKSNELELHLYFQSHIERIQKAVEPRLKQLSEQASFDANDDVNNNNSTANIFHQKSRTRFFTHNELQLEQNRSQIEQYKEVLLKLTEFLQDEHFKEKVKTSDSETLEELEIQLQKDQKWLVNSSVTPPENLNIKLDFYQSILTWFETLSVKSAPEPV